MSKSDSETTDASADPRDKRMDELAMEIHRLRGVLLTVQNLIENDPDNLNLETVVDTVWINPVETLVDYISAVLECKKP